MNVTPNQNFITDISKLDNLDSFKPELPKQEMGKDDFMKLMMAQMQQQDPTNPMDNAEQVAQMAQFSSLEAMNNMSQDMSKLVEAQGQSLAFNAVSYIGYDAKAEGKQLQVLGDGQAEPLEFDLDENATTLKVSISNEEGQLVRTIEPGEAPAGENTLHWDGKDFGGENLDPGVYNFSIKATNSEGEQIDVTTYTIGRIAGTKFEDNQPIFYINGKEFTMGDLKGVYPPAAPQQPAAPAPDQQTATGDSTDQAAGA